MKKGKRLLVVLLATLTLVVGAFSVVYAAVSHSNSHTVSGSASGATLTYRCNYYSYGSGNCEFYHSSSSSTQERVVLECDSTFDSGSTKTTYDGEPHGVVVTGLNGHESIVSQVGDINYSGDGYDLAGAPTDAGSYSATVTIHLSGSGTYARDYVLTRNFTIEKREITPEWSGDSFTYNGQEQVPELTFTSGGTAFDVPADVYEVTYTKASDTSASVASPTDADSYTAKVTLLDTDNYKWAEGSEETFDFTIDPKPIPVVWGDNTEFTYDGQNHAPSVSIDPNRIVKGDQVDVTAEGETTAGTYIATAILTGTNKTNYVVNDATATMEYVIKARPLTVTWKGVNGSPDNFEFVYNNEEQGPTCELDKSGIVKGESCTLEVSGQETNVGDYTATATLSNPNYEIDETAPSAPTHAFSIVKYTVVQLKWDKDKLVYNADYQHPTAEVIDRATGEKVDCELTYKVVKRHSGMADVDVPEGEKMSVLTETGYKYVVSVELEDPDNFRFGQGISKEHEFEITPYPVTAELSIKDTITYDGKYHYPIPTLDKIFDVDKDGVKPVGIITGTPLNGEEVSILLDNDDYTSGPIPTILPDANITDEGVTHASSGNYEATLVGLWGDEASNYALQAYARAEFEIVPRPVTLDWYRPAYDEYGDETGGTPVKVDVAGGKKLNLVFNGKVQAPTAEVKANMLLVNDQTGVKDTCKVTVSGPSNAIESRENPYKVTDISFSNPDYTRDKTGADFYIIAHPVKLSWDKKATTYNGKEQKRTVEITNIQKTARGKDYSADEGIGVVKVSEITYTKGYHFGTLDTDTDEADSTFDGETGYYTDEGDAEKGLAEGTAIAENRTPIDAGTYVMTAAALSDPFNYTLVKINPESIELDPAVIPNTEDEPWYVDDHHPIYKIHQYKITKIDWRNTTVTYNASWQKPIAEVNKSNLQGPDTVKEVAVMITDDLTRIKEEGFLGFCNAKNGYNVYVFKNDGDTPHRGIKGTRSMNYFIGDNAQKMQVKFVINKRPLTVTVYNKTGYYGDTPTSYKHSVKYAGLVNGNVNTDDNHQKKNVPGKYNPKAPASGTMKNVVEGTLKYTTNYKKWGKPGKYSIKASGLKSDNYAIKYVAGTLTIKDRHLAGDFVARAVAGNKKATVYWRTVSGAAKYEIYTSYCNSDDKSYTPKLVKTLGAKSSSYTINKLDSHRYYKFYVVARNSKGGILAKTPIHHFCTNNSCGSFTNPKSITASKTKVTLKKGKTYRLSANVSKVISWKNLTSGQHTQKVRYMSANKNIATVSSNGTIKAVGTGWGRIYVMGANGIWQAVEVTVQ